MFFSSITLRRVAIGGIAAAALAFATLPGQAQMRSQMADQVATKAANAFVSKIQGESCSDFAATMAKMKKPAGATPSPMAGKLKSNPQARTDFVNIVGGPLLNKMIDCNMMPGGM